MANGEDGKDPVREEIIKQCIILAFGVATLIIYTIGQRNMSGPDFVADMKRKLRITRPSAREREAEALAQVQREISWMEHGIPEAFDAER